MTLNQMLNKKAEIEKLIADTEHSDLNTLNVLGEQLHEISVKIAAKWDSVDESSLD